MGGLVAVDDAWVVAGGLFDDVTRIALDNDEV